MAPCGVIVPHSAEVKATGPPVDFGFPRAFRNLISLIPCWGSESSDAKQARVTQQTIGPASGVLESQVFHTFKSAQSGQLPCDQRAFVNSSHGLHSHCEPVYRMSPRVLSLSHECVEIFGLSSDLGEPAHNKGHFTKACVMKQSTELRCWTGQTP